MPPRSKDALGPAPFTDLVDEAIVNSDRKYKSRGLIPSAAGACSRKIAFERFAYINPIDLIRRPITPALRRLFGLGHTIEWHALKWFDKIPAAHEHLRVRYKQQTVTLFELDQVADERPPLIEGAVDFMVEDKDARTIGVGDVKSAKDKFDKAFKTGWDNTLEKLQKMDSTITMDKEKCAFYADDLPAFLKELSDPFFEDNFHQVNSYANAPFVKERGEPYGFIYRYNKNDSRALEVRFRTSDELFEKMKEKFNRVHRTVTLGTIDDVIAMGCDYPLGHIKNAFCDCMWYSGEDDETNNKKAFFRTLPKKKWPTDSDRLGAGEEVENLFASYRSVSRMTEGLGKLELDIIAKLQAEKCSKVRLSDGKVYEVKRLKTGGPGGGPRSVLRESKA